MNTYTPLQLAHDAAQQITDKNVSYLILIDRYNSRDHRACLHNAMYEEMVANGLTVQRFFFEYSPNSCTNEEFKSGCELKELLAKHSNSVLMIFTGGLQFINTRKMEIFEWADAFRGWRKRYFFSSQQFVLWGDREKTLQQLFPFVLPFSVEGMKAMNESLLQNSTSMKWTEANPSYSLVPIQGNKKPDYIKTILGNPTICRWIAACAIISNEQFLPDCLNWKRTLTLGEKLSEMYPKDASSLRVEILLKLNWFIKGEIPYDIGPQLIKEWLSNDDYLTLKKFIDEHGEFE